MRFELQWVVGIVALLGCIYSWFLFFPTLKKIIITKSDVVLKIWELPEVLGAVFWSFLFLLSFALGGDNTEKKIDLRMIFSGIATYLILLFIIYSWFYLRGINFIERFRLVINKLDLKRIFMFFIATLPPVFFIQFLVTLVLGKYEPQETIIFLAESKKIIDILAVIFLAGIVAPFVEELIFRGWIYGVAQEYGGKFSAAIVTSVLFSIIHNEQMFFWGLFVLSFLLILIYEYFQNLWAAIFVHSFFNLFSILVTLLWPEIVL